MTADDLDAAGIAAWNNIAKLMRELGPFAAWRLMLTKEPDATSAAAAWLARQPIARRHALADELLGPATPPY